MVIPINVGSAPAYVLLHEYVSEDIEGEWSWARVDIAPSDVEWWRPVGE